MTDLSPGSGEPERTDHDEMEERHTMTTLAALCCLAAALYLVAAVLYPERF